MAGDFSSQNVNVIPIINNQILTNINNAIMIFRSRAYSLFNFCLLIPAKMREMITGAIEKNGRRSKICCGSLKEKFAIDLTTVYFANCMKSYGVFDVSSMRMIGTVPKKPKMLCNNQGEYKIILKNKAYPICLKRTPQGIIVIVIIRASNTARYDKCICAAMQKKEIATIKYFGLWVSISRMEKKYPNIASDKPNSGFHSCAVIWFRELLRKADAVTTPAKGPEISHDLCVIIPMPRTQTVKNTIYKNNGDSFTFINKKRK